MKCFYHRVDLDGKSSAAIIKYKYPECELVGVNHGDDFKKIMKENKISSGEIVFVVDFALPFDIMISIQKSGKLIWIDHHTSAIEEAKEIGFHCEGYRRTDMAACELVWNYIFPNKKTPLIIFLLGRYDSWNHSEDERIVPFQEGMTTKFKESAPDNMYFWQPFFKNTEVRPEISRLVELGNILLEKKKISNERTCEENAFETELCGYKAIAINRSNISNSLFESVWSEEKYDLMIGFHRTKHKSWKVSLRATAEKMSVPEIARKFDKNSGGHKFAGGFHCKKLPFKF